MDFDSYTYYSIESVSSSYDRATGKHNKDNFVTISKFDYYKETYTRLIQEAAKFLSAHPGSEVGIMKEDAIGITYDQNTPVEKYQFFMVTKHKP